MFLLRAVTVRLALALAGRALACMSVLVALLGVSVRDVRDVDVDVAASQHAASVADAGTRTCTARELPAHNPDGSESFWAAEDELDDDEDDDEATDVAGAHSATLRSFVLVAGLAGSQTEACNSADFQLGLERPPRS